MGDLVLVNLCEGRIISVMSYVILCFLSSCACTNILCPP